MTDWSDDPWICFASEMAEEFFRKHRETMPEDPHVVWLEAEIGYFTFAFSLWAGEHKFAAKICHSTFDARRTSYRLHIESLIRAMEEIPGPVGEPATDYGIYNRREAEYLSLLQKGSSSFFRVLTGSIFYTCLPEADRPFMQALCFLCSQLGSDRFSMVS